MQNTAFQRALVSLSHPVSITALIVVLLNDHWWRRVAPSWFTGKIGDYAWLVFAPFLLAAILAWLIPPRLKHREEIIGRGSIIVVGFVFAFAKTIPAFHSLTIQVLETLTGWGNVLRLDSTDLGALPALMIAWLIWERSANRSIQLPDRGWVLIPLAVLATMANSPAPNYGIACLETTGSQIIGYDAYSAYTSVNGGLTWQIASGQSRKPFCDAVHQSITDPTNPRIQYRFLPGEAIERSEDGGQTWQPDLKLMSMTDAQAAFIEKDGNSTIVKSGPLDALVDRATSNLVLAMGHAGVLVRQANGHWQAVKVGPYGRVDLQGVDKIIVLLAGEGLMALVLLPLMIATLTPLAARARRKRLYQIVTILAWLVWCGTLLVLPPARSTGYFRNLYIPAAILIAVFAAPIALQRVVAIIRQQPAALGPLALVAAISLVLFMLPYVLWSQGGIPAYSTATAFAVVLVVVMMFAGTRYLRKYFLTPSGTSESKVT